MQEIERILVRSQRRAVLKPFTDSITYILIAVLAIVLWEVAKYRAENMGLDATGVGVNLVVTSRAERAEILDAVRKIDGALAAAIDKSHKRDQKRTELWAQEVEHNERLIQAQETLAREQVRLGARLDRLEALAQDNQEHPDG